jgi:hypothetical protein
MGASFVKAGEASLCGFGMATSDIFRSSILFAEVSEIASSLSGLPCNFRLLGGFSFSGCLRFLGVEL